MLKKSAASMANSAATESSVNSRLKAAWTMFRQNATQKPETTITAANR